MQRLRMEKTAVEMRGIVKRFPGVLANDHINFDVKAAEIHALLGENGAGKTTLMNILYGLYQPDEGEIYVHGKKVNIKSPKDAIDLGIGMVHQHFKLVDSLTVAENIVLGLSSSRFFSPLREVEKKAHEFSERYGLKVDPQAWIWQLSAGERQRVEIIKALYRGADVLILDEPTSVLTLGEIEDFFSILQAMVKEGRAIIFITHKLEEVMALSDRVTVLRNGRVVTLIRTSETNKRELAKAMVGREVIFRLRRKRIEKGEVVLKVENLHALNDKGLLSLKGISFVVREGEIFGIAGVAGNGQRELVEVITGLRKAIKGEVSILGENVTNHSAREIAKRGVAHIPGERIRMGIVTDMSVAENLVLTNYWRPTFSKALLLDTSRINEHAKKGISEYNIVTPSPNTPAKLLSGGNIQRVILARETSTEPHLLVAVHPTYGLDVGATEYIRQLLLKQRERKTAVLLVSEDLEEIMALSDRIAVMYEGNMMGLVDAARAKREEIGLMMGGVRISPRASGGRP